MTLKEIIEIYDPKLSLRFKNVNGGFKTNAKELYKRLFKLLKIHNGILNMKNISLFLR